MSEPPMRSLGDHVAPSPPPAELDAIDVTLLRELSKDARAPQRSLANVLGMSSPAVADRMARLKARGVIRGYKVDIDWAALGFSTVAIISVTAAAGHDQSVIVERLQAIAGVENIMIVTGGSDMLVRVRARGFDDLRSILAREIWTIEGVQRTESFISIIGIDPEDAESRLIDRILEGH